MFKSILSISKHYYMYIISIFYTYLILLLYKIKIIPPDYIISGLIDEFSIFYFYIPIIFVFLFTLCYKLRNYLIIYKSIELFNYKILILLNVPIFLLILSVFIPLIIIFTFYSVLKFSLNIYVVYNIYSLLFLITSLFKNNKLFNMIPVLIYILDLFCYYKFSNSLIVSVNCSILLILIKGIICYTLLYLVYKSYLKGCDLYA